MYSKHSAFLFSGDTPADLLSRFAELDTEHLEKTLHQTILSDFSDIPAPHIILRPDSKWRVVSALQKSIRRGDSEMAIRCAVALETGGQSSYLWRRFMVIALEDGGIPMLPLAALIGYLATHSKERKEIGSDRLAAYIAEQMSKCLKDRTFCEVCVVGYHNGATSAELEWLHDSKTQSADLLAAYVNSETQTPIRYLSGTALYGNSVPTADGGREKVLSANPELFGEWLHKQSSLPYLVKYVMRKALAVQAEGFAFAIPLVWENYSKELTHSIVTRALPAAPIINRLPSVAYDKHTIEGKRAISILIHKNAVIGELLKTYTGKESAQTFIGSALFYCEGGSVLANHLVYQWGYYIFHLSLTAEAKRYGYTLLELMDAYHIVEGQLSHLNGIREWVSNNVQ